MRRRFNYTGRERIVHKDVNISLSEFDGRRRFFMDIALGAYGLPADGQVWVEAYDRNKLSRFSFGKVANPKETEPCWLDDFTDNDSFLFRVKVVDATDRSRLLAVAKAISPIGDDDEAGSAKSLLKLASKPLDGRPWKLEFDAADNPILFLDSDIESANSLPRSDGFFQALVFPIVVENILRKILINDKFSPSTDVQEDDEWKAAWIQFAESMPGVSELERDTEQSDDELEQWIEHATASFSRTFNAIHKVKVAMKEVET